MLLETMDLIHKLIAVSIHAQFKPSKSQSTLWSKLSGRIRFFPSENNLQLKTFSKSNKADSKIEKDISSIRGGNYFRYPGPASFEMFSLRPEEHVDVQYATCATEVSTLIHLAYDGRPS